MHGFGLQNAGFCGPICMVLQAKTMHIAKRYAAHHKTKASLRQLNEAKDGTSFANCAWAIPSAKSFVKWGSPVHPHSRFRMTVSGFHQKTFKKLRVFLLRLIKNSYLCSMIHL